MECEVEQLMREYGIEIEIEELKREYDVVVITMEKKCYRFGRMFLVRKLSFLCSLKMWDEKIITEEIVEQLLKEKIYNVSVKVIIITYNTFLVLVKLLKKRF